MLLDLVMKANNAIQNLYQQLHKLHGPQGWWPVSELGGYHPKDFSIPQNPKQRFEICLGAILTQNTSWTQVEVAIENLKKLSALTPSGIKKLNDEKLKKAIFPSGYYNQKAKKIRSFLEFYQGLNEETPKRDDLLSVWGIGPETADSILLYAYQYPSFVVDAYTTRICLYHKLISSKARYHDIQDLFQKSLKKDWKIFQEYHALIVAHAKEHYQKRPYGKHCPLEVTL